MGCNMGCMNSKRKKVFHVWDVVARQVGKEFRVVLLIIDYLPLKSLIRSSRANR